MAAKSFPLAVDRLYEVQVGKSFSKSSSASFHTLNYDFKPASVSDQMHSLLEVGRKNDVTISIPNAQNDSATNYQGSAKEATKECVLIIEADGTCTLEKLSSIIQVKQSRSKDVVSSAMFSPATPASLPSLPDTSAPVPQAVSTRQASASAADAVVPMETGRAHNLSASTESSDSSSGSSSSSDSSTSDSSSSDDDDESDLADELEKQMFSGAQPSAGSKKGVPLHDDLAVSDSDSDS